MVLPCLMHAAMCSRQFMMQAASTEVSTLAPVLLLLVMPASKLTGSMCGQEACMSLIPEGLRCTMQHAECECLLAWLL